VKDTGGRKTAGANARLLEKIRSKKPPADHSSVVIRSTSSVTAHNFCRPNLPYGKTAALPSTLTPQGLFEPSKMSVASNAAGSANGLDRTGGGGVSEMVQINSAPASPTRGSPEMFGSPGKPGNTRLFGQQSTGTIYEEGEEVYDMTTTTRPGTSTSTKHSGGTSTTRNQGDRPLLFGPAKGFIVRIKGEVFRIDTVNSIFATGPLVGLINDYANPGKLSFIPASTVLVPTPRTRASELQEVAMMEANGSILAEGDKSTEARSVSPTFEALAQSLGQAVPAGLNSPASTINKSGKSRNVTMLPAVSSTNSLVGHASAKDRSSSPSRSRSQTLIEKQGTQSTKSSASNISSKNSSPSVPKLRKAIVPGQARDTRRDFEIRKTVEDILFDSFRSILDSVPVKDYAQAVLRDANQTNPLMGGLSLDAGTSFVGVF
jgi:hypothetical protein